MQSPTQKASRLCMLHHFQRIWENHLHRHTTSQQLHPNICINTHTYEAHVLGDEVPFGTEFYVGWIETRCRDNLAPAVGSAEEHKAHLLRAVVAGR